AEAEVDSAGEHGAAGEGDGTGGQDTAADVERGAAEAAEERGASPGLIEDAVAGEADARWRAGDLKGSAVAEVVGAGAIGGAEAADGEEGGVDGAAGLVKGSDAALAEGKGAVHGR